MTSSCDFSTIWVEYESLNSITGNHEISSEVHRIGFVPRDSHGSILRAQWFKMETLYSSDQQTVHLPTPNAALFSPVIVGIIMYTLRRGWIGSLKYEISRRIPPEWDEYPRARLGTWETRKISPDKMEKHEKRKSEFKIKIRILINDLSIFSNLWREFIF